jgi:septal ring factor EnvC (AmiA/AmiB activator)
MVDSGQKIASAGSTGGLLRPALYFEIRHNGNPDDPLKWCKL